MMTITHQDRVEVAAGVDNQNIAVAPMSLIVVAKDDVRYRVVHHLSKSLHQN
jgi:hypothetical protein